MAKQIVVPDFVRDSLGAGRLQLEDGEYWFQPSLPFHKLPEGFVGMDDDNA